MEWNGWLCLGYDIAHRIIGTDFIRWINHKQLVRTDRQKAPTQALTSWMKFNSKNTESLLFINECHTLYAWYIYNYSWKLFTKLNIINEIFNRSKLVCLFFNEYINIIKHQQYNHQQQTPYTHTHSQWNHNSKRTFQHAISIINSHHWMRLNSGIFFGTVRLISKCPGIW